MKASLRLLRDHLHFIIVITILLVVMTWPTFHYVFDTNVFWLPTGNRDIFMKFWNGWHGMRVFRGLSAFNSTDALFYPVGMSLNYHPHNVFHMILLASLRSLISVSNAYSLIYLFFIFVTALSGYFFLLYLLKDKWLALFGAVVFGLSQHVISHSHQPDINLLVTIPLALYAFHRGIAQARVKWMVICGVFIGISAFVGMYVFVCQILAFGVLGLYFAWSRWRNRKFWTSLLLVLTVAGLVSCVRIYPMMQNTEAFDDAIKKMAGRESGNDLMAFFVNYRNPVTAPLFFEAFDIEWEGVRLVNGWKHTSYLGYLPLVLMVIGFCRAKYRRNMLPWLLLLAPFFMLRLGSELRINDIVYSNVLLPKYYLDTLFPAVFEAVHETDHFHMGILLPLAILSCYGLKALIELLPARLRTSFILLCVFVLAFEYYTPLDSAILNRRDIKFNNWFLEQDDQESIRLINLPMGRDHAKIYLFYQTLNGYPHAEGVAHRTPQASYSFIVQNDLLNDWFTEKSVRCTPTNAAEYQSTVEELLEVGFSHVILHVRESGADDIRESFDNLLPAYKDTFAEVYLLTDMLDHCANLAMWLQEAPAHLRTFIQSHLHMRQSDTTVLSFHTGDTLSDQAMRYYAIMLESWNELIHVFEDEQGTADIVSTNPNDANSNRIATKNRIFWLIYNPQEISLPSSSTYAKILSGNLASCEIVNAAGNLTIDIHIDRAYPCELITDEDPPKLEYDNGIQLANVLHETDNDVLQLHFWWNHLKTRGYAYSVQIFNANGDKVQQIDDVFDLEPLARHDMDISSLAPGDYVAQLIVYNFETKQSQPGTILGTGLTFQRELEIARFTVEA